MRRIGYLLFWIVALASAESGARPQSICDRELPPLAEILDSAFRRYELDFVRFAEWERAARRSAFLPKLLVGVDVDFDTQSAVQIEDNVSVSSETVTVGPPESSENFEDTQGQSVGVKLQWEFDKALYHRDQIWISRERRSVAELRIRLAERLGELYGKRDAARSLLLAAPNAASRAKAEAECAMALRGLEGIGGLGGGL